MMKMKKGMRKALALLLSAGMLISAGFVVTAEGTTEDTESVVEEDTNIAENADDVDVVAETQLADTQAADKNNVETTDSAIRAASADDEAAAANSEADGNKVLSVGKDCDYQTIQSAINHIEEQDDKTGWTIEVQSGEYARFIVLNGMHNLTVKAADGANVVIATLVDGDDVVDGVIASGAYPNTEGISIRSADNVKLEGLNIQAGTVASPWYASAVSTFTESGVKSTNLQIENCVFTGTDNANPAPHAVFINTGTKGFTVTGCSFTNFKEAVSMYGDGTPVSSIQVANNTFSGCSFAIHGYYGGTDGGVLSFSGNTVTGTDNLRTKVVLQDQTNTGAFQADVQGNTFTNALVGLVNLREEGETVSDVLTSNTMDKNSFYVEAVEPGTIDFYTSYRAPEGSNGKWVLTGIDNLDVDWGKNPADTTAYIQKLVDEANANGSHELNITGIPEGELIRTFTWFKDAIYWETSDEETPVVPIDPVDPVEPAEWEISKSKTATNLDENFESEVTLSLPSAEEQLVSDVVFVLDKSTSDTVEDEMIAMLNDLSGQAESVNAKVNVGVVIFNKVANTELELTELNAASLDAIEAAIKTEVKSGTNIHAGLLAGKQMLDNDKSTANTRKYLILVSDGISYLYCKNNDPTVAYTVSSLNGGDDGNGNRNCKPVTGMDCYDIKYGAQDYVPEDWDTYMEEIDAQVANTQYDFKYENAPTALDSPFSIPYAERKNYAVNVDKSLYYSYQLYQECAQDYHCYAVAATEDNKSNYKFGKSFMEYLAGGNEYDFRTIQNDIHYLLDAGSRVEDYIGYVADDYNFDFINDASKLTMKVGENVLQAKKISENRYGFGKKTGNTYDYEVEYVPGNLMDEEHFVWYINVPVSNFETAQLTYTVKLMNPKNVDGTYGQYDADGSEGYQGLYTNNSATLYPVDSNGEEGTPEEFGKPTVDYTVKNVPTAPNKPTTPNQTVQKDTKKGKTPKTGDSSSLIIWEMMLGAAVVGLSAAGMTVRRNRKRK